ncbi:MAG TPA: hypothetical protein VJA25_09175 [Dehalococcoidia bacterium]|nr:hypothetical protein [Dehalococcoidia bacterium]
MKTNRSLPLPAYAALAPDWEAYLPDRQAQPVAQMQIGEHLNREGGVQAAAPRLSVKPVLLPPLAGITLGVADWKSYALRLEEPAPSRWAGRACVATFARQVMAREMARARRRRPAISPPQGRRKLRDAKRSTSDAVQGARGYTDIHVRSER